MIHAMGLFKFGLPGLKNEPEIIHPDSITAGSKVPGLPPSGD
jgi:hypothetical protein